MSRFLHLVAIWLCINACEQSGYSSRLKSEYNSGIRNDSLFLGFYFGKTRKEFFTHGWEVNKKGLIMQGSKNQTVSYVMHSPDGSKDIEMMFFPQFDNQLVIKNMLINFQYKGWAPWNRGHFSDSLLVAVKDTVMKWYGGNAFESTVTDNNVEVWYKVDGNRQISLAIQDEREVSGIIKDLFHADNDPFK